MGDTVGGGANCTLGGGSFGGWFGSTLGDNRGGTGGSGATRVSFCTLGDRRGEISVGMDLAGGFAGLGLGEPDEAQIWHASHKAVMASSWES